MTTYEPGRCPGCGAGEGVELASGEEVREEVEALWAFHLRRLRPSVPPRRLSDRLAFSQDPPLRVARCPRCGTVYRDPRERRRAVLGLYAEESPAPEALRGLFETQRRSYREQAARLTRILGRTGAGVEVGSYVGAFLAAAGEAGWEFRGLDVNASAVGFARGLGLSAERGTLEETAPPRRFDAVAIWNCFDQLPDPRATVCAARECLVPGGVLAIRVPNGAFYAALRRLRGPAGPLARGLLAHNNLLGFPYLYGFTPGSLSGLLAGAGFEVVGTVGDALVPVADEWTRRWAAWEERAVKAALRACARWAPAPWFEVYARFPGR